VHGFPGHKPLLLHLEAVGKFFHAKSNNPHSPIPAILDGHLPHYFQWRNNISDKLNVIRAYGT
jgi:hypothetical protein